MTNGHFLKVVFLICLTSGFVFGAEETIESNQGNVTQAVGDRQGKVFSLFSVVQFKNTVCTSTNSNLNGTCFTSSECSNKGGSAYGNCASGFGVCCVFTVSVASGGTVSQNNTYLQNPNYPSVYSSTSAVSYTVNKVCADVCFLRLDFNTFVLVGPQTGTYTVQSELSPLCPDSFTITTPTGQSIPKICGQNTGQHIYVDIGTGSSDSATIAFAFSSTVSSTNRQWNIRVSQIRCASQTSPPSGCLQYYYAPTGRIQTFNFPDTTGGHLDNQLYSACIRPELGYCCVKYSVCADQTSPFTLNAASTKGLTDNNCNSLDYVIIEGSSTTCSTIGVNLYSRYCGGALTTDSTTTIAQSVQICDCTPPFEVGIFTNALADAQVISTIAIANTVFSRGVCLDYLQIPCGTG